MTRSHSFIQALSVGGALTLVLGCTTRAAENSASASPSPSPYSSPYASPSPYGQPASGGDVVDKAREGAHKAGEVIKDTAQEVKEKAKPAAQEAGAKAKEAGREAGTFIDAKKQSVEVKAALLADKTIDASGIDVDTDSDAKTVTLKGSVPTEAQKAAAGRLARKKADADYTIRNLLTVVAVPPKSK